MTIKERGTRKSSGKARSQPEATEAAASAAKDRLQRIAEAAYYNAERRGFEGDLELEDWLEAERRIDSRASGSGVQHEASARAEGPRDVSTPAVREDRRSAADGELIEPDQMEQWAKKLKVPAVRLREAIARVGPVASDVKQFLKR